MFYFVGCVVVTVSFVFVLFRIGIGGGGWEMLIGLVPILFYGALIMAGGLLFQWLPQASETLTKILNNLERLNEGMEKLAKPPEDDALVRESDGEDI